MPHVKVDAANQCTKTLLTGLGGSQTIRRPSHLDSNTGVPEVGSPGDISFASPAEVESDTAFRDQLDNVTGGKATTAEIECGVYLTDNVSGNDLDNRHVRSYVSRLRSTSVNRTQNVSIPTTKRDNRDRQLLSYMSPTLSIRSMKVRMN
jgi:hypothetical protein